MKACIKHSIDDTYRNVNGMIMQLGTVQYCFTYGKKGLPNGSVQTREMVDLYRYHRDEFDKILQEAHQMVIEPGYEIVGLLQLDDYDLLRCELIKQGITTIEQLKSIDIWNFMRQYELYDSPSKRHEIATRVHDLLNPPDVEEDSQDYCMKTKNGRCFYGGSPAGTLAALCDSLAVKYPLKMRTLIGQRYNGVGLAVLYPSKPAAGGIKLSNLNAYIDIKHAYA